MKRAALFLGIFLSLSLFASGENEVLKAFLQEGQLMPKSGKYKNEFIENNEKRTLIRLTVAQKEKFGISIEDLAFANFRHDAEFYIATFPSIRVKSNQRPQKISETVEEVIFVKKHWAKNARPETASVEVHSELVFKFKDSAPLKLVYNQTKKDYTDISLTGAVYSIETARGQDGLSSNFMEDALGPNFAIARRFYSLSERKSNYDKQPDTVQSFSPLNFSNTKTKDNQGDIKPQDYLLYQAIRESDVYGRNQTYLLLENNCTSRLFDLLDSSLLYNQSTNGKINFQDIDNGYIDFVNNDLEELLQFIIKFAGSKGYSLPPGIGLMSATGTAKGIALESLDDMKKFSAANGEDPRNFFYNIPIFINGHLKARGLVDYIKRD